ncbi:TPA: hypothetical protein VAM19_000907, partial [Acinetobacter baumannii]|nr:hypothetical protein [Acinetobacter baumannii]
MALTPQTFQNLERDIEDTGKAINTDAVIVPRYGNPFDSLPRAIRLFMEAGLFRPFATESELLAYVPTITPSAGYAFDSKKLYLWNGSAWIDEGLSPLDLSKNYFNQNFKLLNSYLSKSTAKNGIFTPIFENEFQTLANTSITDAGIFETTTAYRVLIFPILENDRLKGRIYTGA